ncbi:MAG: alpha/beta fold hydrolase [Nostoc sp.]|uniref:alpha/beta hydrolase n=1 Tax=Nostoc sp. TaxID=1180 RepID=UPI002FEE73B1
MKTIICLNFHDNNWYSKIAVTAIALVTPLIQSVVAVSPVNATTPTPASASHTICEQVKQTVSLQKGQPATYKVVGELCYKPNHKNVVQLLLSGATYSHLYWNFPLHPEQYSYVRALTNAGYATFNLERIGIGESDHSSADKVTLQANAYVAHQIVQALRDGRLGKFSQVILVGHSLGSGIAVLEAAQYGDVNGIVLTGFLHNKGPGFGDVGASVYPAQQDLHFADQNLPGVYLTTFPGKRSIFYSTPNTDPEVIALDELTKETITLPEAQEFPLLVADFNNARNIRVPVLIVMGQFDKIFCQAQCPEAQAEPTYYQSSPKVEVKVLKNVGHDLNLHRNATALFTTVIDWSKRFFGY